MISFVAVLGAVASGQVAVDLPSYYVSSAIVVVNTGKTTFGDLQANSNVVPADIMALRTQVDILRSPSLVLRVIDHLRLVDNPEIAAVIQPKPSVLSNVSARLGLAWFTTVPDGAETDRQRAAAYLMQNVSVQNDGRSYAIAIQTRSASPVLCAEISNAFAREYIDFNRQLKITSISRGGVGLDQRLAPLRARVQAAEEAVEVYRKQNRLVIDRTVSGDGRQNVTTADLSLAQVTTQLLAVNNDLAERRSRLQAVQSALHGQGSLFDLPDVIGSPLIQRLRDRDAENSAREKSLGQTLAGANPQMQAATAATADTRRQITAEAAKVAASLESSVRAVEMHRDQLNASLQGIRDLLAQEGAARIGLRQLDNEAEAARTIYTDYLRRYEMASNNASMQEPEAELISAAEIPIVPAGPPRLQLIVLATLASTVLAGMVALFIDRSGTGIRSAEQLEAETGLLAFGFIPASRQASRLLHLRRRSPYSESVRQVGSLLAHSAVASSARVIGVTSALPREGKSVFCRSLASSLSQNGKRVLLIDGHMHPSSLSRLGRWTRRPSVLDAAGTTKLYRDFLQGVDMCCSCEQTAEMTTDAHIMRLRRIIKIARSTYDHIILDLPPALATADAPQLAQMSDAVVLVVCWARTSTQAVLAASRTLGMYGVRILGGVLTQVKLKRLWHDEGSHAQLYQRHTTYFD